MYEIRWYHIVVCIILYITYTAVQYIHPDMTLYPLYKQKQVNVNLDVYIKFIPTELLHSVDISNIIYKYIAYQRYIRSTIYQSIIHSHTDIVICDTINQYTNTQNLYELTNSSTVLDYSDVYASTHSIIGESNETESYAIQFQKYLHQLQHPVDCTRSKYVIEDISHGAGFGSVLHQKGVTLSFAARMNRVYIDTDPSSYTLPYSSCTRQHGLRGCDLLAPLTHCTLPSDWRAQHDRDMSEHQRIYGPYSGSHDINDIAQYLSPLTYILGTDIWIKDRYEWYASSTEGWSDTYARHLAFIPTMPLCWWKSQSSAYLMRLTPTAKHDLLVLASRSLRLPQPDQTAAIALQYADTQYSDTDTVIHWWYAIQALKTQWQLNTIGSNDTQIPSLGYVFIRHGDKNTEAALHSESEYYDKIIKLYNQYQLQHWYIGADDLLSPDIINTMHQSNNDTLILYNSILVQEIVNKSTHPFAHGFDISVAAQTSDEQRYGIVWRTLLESTMTQLCDIIVSTWSSNHPRLMYELTTAISTDRLQLPFITLG